MSGKRLYLSPPHLSGEEQGLVAEAFASNWIAPLGPHVDAFEKEMTEYVGVGHAAALSSGTAALHLAMRLLGVGAGDEVLCSTFTFSARLPEAQAPPNAIPRPMESLVGLRVLAVDDHATNRRLLEDVLAGWKMNATVVGSAPLALAELRRAAEAGQPYPLLLLDAHMPDVDGFTLAWQVRQSPALVGTVFVMLTSAGQPDDLARCRELGISATLIKPIKQSDLLNTLLGALDVIRRVTPTPVPIAFESPLRILLAEDNVVNQKLAVRLLEKRGHLVTVAATGVEAVEATRRVTFDLVLMDVQMPDMDGLEATRIIRERERETGRRIPIIAMTARAMKGDRESCLDSGMDGYLAKPIQPRELFEVLENVGAGKKRLGESPA